MPTILTSRKRAVVVALVAGVCLTAAGHLLAHLGGWGPCGPAGAVSEIGGALIAYPLLVAVFALLPGIESWLIELDSPFVNNAAIPIALPVLLWAVLVFLALLVGSRLRRRVERGRPPSEL